MQGPPLRKATTDFQEQLFGFRSGSAFPDVLLPVTTQRCKSLHFYFGGGGERKKHGVTRLPAAGT